MPRGGRRLNSGPKPRVVQMPAPAPDVTALLLTPPDDLTSDEAAVWRECAPLAVANSTLTEATAPGFRYLCEVTVRYRALGLVVDTEGWQSEQVRVDGAGTEHVEKKAHPLWTKLEQFARRREHCLRSYGLIGSGRPAPVKAATANPWAKTS